MEGKKVVFKINNFLKTLLKAEIITIIIPMLFTLCVFAIDKNAFYSISCRQAESHRDYFNSCSGKPTSAIYKLVINMMSRQSLMRIMLLIK